MKYLYTKFIYYIVFSYLFFCGIAEYVSAELQDDPSSSILAENYRLKIIPFLNNSTFEGEVTIQFSVLENETQVAFEAGYLVIKGIYLENEQNIAVSLNLTQGTLGRWLISSEHSFLGVYKLQILFSGQINNIKDEGALYYASYFNNEAKSLYLASRSTMEGQQTCKLFPCLARSTVQIPVSVFIARFGNQTSLSNMPLKSSSKPDENLLEGRIWDQFHETPNISPRQVGFSVHELSRFSNHSFTILAASDVLEQATLAVSLLPTVEKALNTWLMNSTFPFPKLDILALPDTSVDMAHSPGLALCREDKLLYKEWINNAQNKFTITMSLVNILAHQWFSHPITFQSWLIDGIVTYLEYKIVFELEPLWEMNKLIFQEIFQKAMIEDYKNHKDSRNTDFMLYKKATAVLKMAESMSSEAVIRESLQTLYTIRGQVSLNQLFAALDNARDKSADLPFNWSLSAVLQMWVSQPGYPVLTVAENESSLLITQDDYLDNGNEWPILLTYATQHDTQLGVSYLHTWLLPEESKLCLPFNESKGWVLLNVQNAGYYRVKYSSKYWQLLMQQLMANHSMISAVSRSQLIDDAFQLAWAVKLDYSFVFDLGYYLPYETNHIPWATAAINFDQLLRLFYGTQLGRDLKKYVQELYSPYFASVIDVVSYNEPHIAKRSRMEAFHWACHWQLPQCVQFTTALFKQWQSSTFRFPPEYKPAALCTGVKLFPSVFFEVFDSFTASNIAADRLVFIAALACTSNQTHLNFLLRTAFLRENQLLIRHNEKTKLLEGIVVTSENVHLVVKFLVLNYNKTISVIGAFMMDSIWSILENALVLEDNIKLVERLVDDTSLSVKARQQLDCSLSTARALRLDATRLAPLVSGALRSVTLLTTTADETTLASSSESSTHSGCSVLGSSELFIFVLIGFVVVIDKIK